MKSVHFVQREHASYIECSTRPTVLISLSNLVKRGQYGFRSLDFHLPNGHCILQQNLETLNHPTPPFLISFPLRFLRSFMIYYKAIIPHFHFLSRFWNVCLKRLTTIEGVVFQLFMRTLMQEIMSTFESCKIHRCEYSIIRDKV